MYRHWASHVFTAQRASQGGAPLSSACTCWRCCHRRRCYCFSYCAELWPLKPFRAPYNLQGWLQTTSSACTKAAFSALPPCIHSSCCHTVYTSCCCDSQPCAPLCRCHCLPQHLGGGAAPVCPAAGQEGKGSRGWQQRQQQQEQAMRAAAGDLGLLVVGLQWKECWRTRNGKLGRGSSSAKPASPETDATGCVAGAKLLANGWCGRGPGVERVRGILYIV